MRYRLFAQSLFALVLALCLALPGQALAQKKFRIPLKKSRLPVGMVEGRVTDRGGKPIGAQIAMEETKGNPPKSTAVPVDPASGVFQINLPPGKYKLTATAEGYVGVALNIEVRDKFRAKVPIRLKKAKLTPQEAAAEKAQPAESVSVRYDRDANLGQEISEDDVRKIEIEEAIRYGAEETMVPSSGEALLKKLAALMQKDETLVRLVITGHSHRLGDRGLEKRRSQRRAVYAKNFLIDAGIDPSRLRVRAEGAADLIASGDDEESRGLNDRVNFELWKLK